MYENALDLLFLAMAEYTPKQPEKARTRLREADKEINRLNAVWKSESAALRLSRVWNRLELRILLGEAESLVNKR
jgi:hypothetical protein